MRQTSHVGQGAARTAGSVLVVCVCSAIALGGNLVMKDGRELKGVVGAATSLAESDENPGPEDAPRPILFVDNDLYRIFVPKFQAASVNNAPAPGMEMIHLKQPLATYGSRLGTLGPLTRTTPWDSAGQRTVTMKANVPAGQIDVIQGITVLTPRWAKVQSLQRAKGANYLWEMRIATSSIPRDVLAKLLARQISSKKPDERLKVVRLYLGAERYADAERELTAIMTAFPEMKHLEQERIAIRQLGAKRNLQEIELRQSVGRHRLAYGLLEKFPTQDVSGAVLQQIKAMQEDYRARLAAVEGVKQTIDRLLEEIQQGPVKAQLAPLLAEICRELNLNTLDRMTDFRRLADDGSIAAENRLALAGTGWLLGGSAASDSASLAASAFATRQQVVAYLRESDRLRRRDILAELGSEEAATPQYIARLAANMKPPLATADAPLGGDSRPAAGFYSIGVPGAKGTPDVTYYVQLPPEYDPYRRYPAIVSLHGAGNTAKQQVDWWCGAADADGHRLGHAGRYGYIVIVPEWTKAGQSEYQYTYREHAAVLSSLRDACRRFAVNTDRVFLSGHSMGGDGAWDIALAHPDLWAGVVPIVAAADKFVPRYATNSQYVPMYLVGGEMDGDKTIRNAKELDRYLSGTKHDVSVVEYRGRGHEDFIEDVLNIFDWMNRRERSRQPTDFTVATLRDTDNFFWWVELDEIPEKSLAVPEQWPPPKDVKPMLTTAKLTGAATGTQTLSVQTAAGRATIWLSPEMIDFSRPVRIQVARRPSVPGPKPSLETLLEDLRTRGDRQHPYWAKVEIQSGAIKPAVKAAKRP